MEDWKARDLAIEEHVADNYDKLYDSTRFAHLMYDSFVTEVLKRTEKGPVLELACGTGAVTKRLKAGAPSITTYCMDFSPKMLAIAKSRCDHCLQGDLEELSYGGKFFQTIYVHSALHHFQSFDKIFQGVYRIMKDNGYFVIQEPNEDMADTTFLKLLRSGVRKLRVKSYTDLSHLEGDTKPSDHHGKIYAKDIVEALQQNGFEVLISKEMFFATAYLRQFDSSLVFKLAKILDKVISLPRGYMFLIVARKARS